MNPPAPVSPSQVGQESLETQIRLAPQQFAAESEYAPQYSQLYQNIMRQTLLGSEGQPGLLSTYSEAAPAISDLQAQLNRAQRMADISDVQQLGLQATQAFQQANPQLMQLQGEAVNRALSGGNYVQGVGAAPGFNLASNPLLGQLQAQAQQQLAAGGQLGGYETSRIAGQVAEQYNTMGRAQDPITTATAALGLDAAQRARLMEAQNLAAGVAGMQTQQQQLGLGAQELGAQYGLAYGTANQQAAYQNELLRQQQLQQASGLAAATAQDPYALILGRSGGFGQIAGAMGQAGSFPTSTGNFDPFNQGIMNIYAGNQANQMAAATATAQNRAGMTGSLIGAAGALGGGALVAGGMVGASALNAKAVMLCIPSGALVDVPSGQVAIDTIKPGDHVIGFDGNPIEVSQVHCYKDDPTANRFLRFEFEDGSEVNLCENHRMADRHSKDYKQGEIINGKRIMAIKRYGGVSRSYDLVTADKGYRMAGVPVNSMVVEMALKIAEIVSNQEAKA